MGNRNKEDEKMERAIRSLMKLPDNRRCINCNNLGPQYICTTFATFVCMNCSGIHREFTHRVKSISVSKFTAEEVTALQAGGNERARQMYFKLWDLQRHSFPDTSNLNRLRDFIKSVYVDRRYTGESSNPGPSRLPLKVDSHRIRGGSYDEESYEKSFAARYAKNDPRNPPSLSAVIPWTGSQRRNPVRFEVVDDRVRAEGLGSRRRSQGDPMPRNILPKSNPNMQISGLPTVRPLEEILGRSIQALRVSKISNERSEENAECSTMNKEPPKPAENKVEITQSLIDFEAEAEPSNNKALCEETQSPNVISLESLLFDLSVPSENTRDVLPAATLLSIEDDGVRGEPNQPANNDLKQTSGVTSKSSLMSLADENGVSLEQTSLVRAQNNEVSHVNFVPISATLVQADVGSPSVLPEETKSRSRMELPLDLFTANYSSMATPPVSGWQTAPARGMGFNYYPHTMPVPAFPNQAKSINPFDISDERSQFPSMGSLHGVLPNSSGIGTYSSQPPYLMPQQSYYPGSYMGQGVHNNIQPAREQNDTAAIYSEHANLNSSMGKNPFG